MTDPGGFFAVARFRVPEPEAASFAERASAALAALSVRPGFRGGAVGRAVDDAELWSITTTWESTGTYRRALSAYDVKVTAVPLLSLALDEPGAFEVVAAGDGLDLGSRSTHGGWGR